MGFFKRNTLCSGQFCIWGHLVHEFGKAIDGRFWSGSG